MVTIVSLISPVLICLWCCNR